MEVTGTVHLAEPIFARDFSFLASAVTTALPKLTIPRAAGRPACPPLRPVLAGLA